MRAFWILIALLAILTGAVFAFRGGSGREPPAPDTTVFDTTPIAPSPPRVAPEPPPPPPPVETAAPSSPAPPPPTATPSKPEEQPLDLDAALIAAATITDPAPAPPPPPAPEPTEPAAPKEPGAEPVAAEPESEAPPTPPPSPIEAPAPAAEAATLEGAGEAKVLQRPDGSYLIDDKYPLRGRGTRDNPYLITWDYLLSAQETYQPRLGQKKLPDRVKLLSGKHVKITGWVAFPIIAQEPTEMLMMLNQWDGCCIGVPPTPYDAVEVKLRDPAEPEQRLIIYGNIRGKFTVEPYLVKDWLVSLYAMEDAVLEAEE
jgi:hypothetical protein